MNLFVVLTECVFTRVYYLYKNKSLLKSYLGDTKFLGLLKSYHRGNDFSSNLQAFAVNMCVAGHGGREQGYGNCMRS